MATGMHIPDSDNLHCSVCLDHFFGRNPRLLNCHHCFCEKCLQQLIKKRKISCPICRDVTKVKDNDVKNLKINFYILPLLEECSTHLQEKRCQLCSTSDACFACEKCKQLLCECCSEKHNNLHKFKDHVLVSLCGRHLEGVFQICTKCVKPVCFKCLILEHHEHEEDVVFYDEGIKRFRKNLNEVGDQINKDLCDINEVIEGNDIKLREAEKLIKMFRLEKQENEAKSKKATKRIDKITKYVSKNHSISKKQKAIAENMLEVANEILLLQESGDDQLLAHFGELMQTINSNSNEIVNNMKIIPPVFEVTSTIGTTKMKMVTRIYNQFESQMGWIRSGVSIFGDSIILADYLQNLVKLINTNGVIENIFNLQAEYGLVRDVSMHGSSLYIAQEYGISQVSDISNVEIETKRYMYKIDIGKLGRFCVVSHTKILYSDYENGTIYQYDPHERTTKMVKDGIDKPKYINTMMHQDGVKYIVTLEGEDRLQVYNSKWEYEFSVGKGTGSRDGFLSCPQDCACTDEGILVVDFGNNRVCLFDFAGDFIRHCLTKEDGLQYPRCLSYKSPCLWVFGPDLAQCYEEQHEENYV